MSGLEMQSRPSDMSGRGSKMNRNRGRIKAALAALTCLVAMLVVAPAASAQFEFEKTSVTLTDPNGAVDHRAGSHPDLRFDFRVKTVTSPVSGAGEVNVPTTSVHDALLDLPPGFLGNANSLPKCTAEEFYARDFGIACPVESQVGAVKVQLGVQSVYVGVYNIEPGPNVPAQFGFNYLGQPVFITPSVRAGDYGISSGALSTPQVEPIREVQLTLWGVPALPAHDAERAPKGTVFYMPPGNSTPSNAPARAFLSNPTSCGGPQAFTARGDSWEDPGLFQVIPLVEEPGGAPFEFEGCENLQFGASVTAHTTSAAADSPTGFSIDIDVPQNEGPAAPRTPDVRKVVTTLPAGMAVSDSSASGLGSCSQAQLGIGTNAAPTCPASSILGTVRIKSPLLEGQLEGGVYLAQQKANPFGTTLALYLALKGPGFYLKLPGRVDADPDTGQLTTTFDNTPQLPFETLHLELKSGPRAPLVNPRQCGTYSVKSEIVPWSGTAPVHDESTFKVDQACAGGGFSPGFKAGTANPKAGSFSPFTLRVTRADGEQNLSSIKASLPEGLLAKLGGVPVCGDAQAASGDCPGATQVGIATIAVGSGPTPIFVPEAGKAPTGVYLAGPYKGAPYSLVVKVPAEAGPFNLGTVAVRNALRVDPVTTQVTTESDPLPQILEGIPVSYRDIRVEINRSEFTVNPTNCEAKKIAGSIGGADGGYANPSAPFAAASCATLGLQPRLAIKFSGAPTRRGGHPKLTATLTAKKGDSNLKQVQVTLPETEYLENAHIKTVCTRVQYAASQCPQRSIYGYARAWTPLLDKPLEGPVYLRSSNHKLPDLVASLDGQIHIDLDGRISSYKSRIRNTFENVPDAPVSKFMLTMQGGGKGLLVNNTQLCKAKPKATVVFDGQNGKTAETNPLVSVGGCGKGKKKTQPKK
jgi:hypothetical protein